MTFTKTKFISNGQQGHVYLGKYKNKTVAIKEFALDEDEWQLFDNPTSKKALKECLFIEQKANEMINNVLDTCPHFPKHYKAIYDKKHKTAHHINEYIPDSVQFFDWIQDHHTLESWVNVYTQIIYALHTLHTQLNMIHLDLHCHNILIQKLRQEKKLTYIINKKQYTIKIKYKVFIIDFGHAYVPGMLRSWFSRERFRPCRIHLASDLINLYKSCVGLTTAPKEFNKKLRDYIKIVKKEQSHVHVLQDLLTKS